MKLMDLTPANHRRKSQENIGTGSCLLPAAEGLPKAPAF